MIVNFFNIEWYFSFKVSFLISGLSLIVLVLTLLVSNQKYFNLNTYSLLRNEWKENVLITWKNLWFYKIKKIFTKIKSKQIKISKDQNTFFIKSNSFINFDLNYFKRWLLINFLILKQGHFLDVKPMIIEIKWLVNVFKQIVLSYYKSHKTLIMYRTFLVTFILDN